MTESKVIFYEPSDKPIPEQYRDKPMKTHAEFLRELKEFVKAKVKYWEDYLPDYGCSNEGFTVACEILDEIKQFEAQLGGDEEKQDD
jgi:hypothetical protein